MTLRVAPVASRSDRRLFREVAARLHGGDPCFVPPLDIAFDLVLDRARSPFWGHAEAQEFLAWRGSAPVGRIGACRDRDLEKVEPGCGVVGFFECGEDPEAARSLFETALAWLRERGLRRARGPLNYSIHDTGGLLVEGFDTPPTFDTTWNPAYYENLWRDAGFASAKDLLACAGPNLTGGAERVHRFADLARKAGVVARPLDLGHWREEAERVRLIYNSAWAGNWGHVPIGREEFYAKARDMKSLLDPALVRIAEYQGEPIGIYLGLPDYNPAIRRARGRLLPFGWWHILRAKRRAGRCRVILLGVVPGKRVRGVEALLLAEGYRAMGANYDWAEASWVLADNAALLNGLALYNLRPYKRWRIFERAL